MEEKKNNTVDNSIRKLNVLGNESEEEKNKLRNDIVELMAELSDLLMVSIDAGYNVSIMMHNSYAMNEKGEVKRLGVHYSMFVPVADVKPVDERLIMKIQCSQNVDYHKEEMPAIIVIERNKERLMQWNGKISVEDGNEIGAKFDYIGNHFELVLDKEMIDEATADYLLKEGIYSPAFGEDFEFEKDFKNMKFKIKKVQR